MLKLCNHTGFSTVFALWPCSFLPLIASCPLLGHQHLPQTFDFFTHFPLCHSTVWIAVSSKIPAYFLCLPSSHQFLLILIYFLFKPRLTLYPASTKAFATLLNLALIGLSWLLLPAINGLCSTSIPFPWILFLRPCPLCLYAAAMLPITVSQFL